MSYPPRAAYTIGLGRISWEHRDSPDGRDVPGRLKPNLVMPNQLMKQRLRPCYGIRGDTSGFGDIAREARIATILAYNVLSPSEEAKQPKPVLEPTRTCAVLCVALGHQSLAIGMPIRDEPGEPGKTAISLAAVTRPGSEIAKTGP